MDSNQTSGCQCNPEAAGEANNPTRLEMLPLYTEPVDDEPCCGPPAGPPSSVDEQPGYSIRPFVDGFLSTPVGKVPKVKTVLGRQDYVGTFGARLGVIRNDYKVAPGLYAAGTPGPESPVLLTANYKLSFDHLRKELSGLQAWLLVLDTRGINVWCAAGKGTFGTQEIIQRVKATQLGRVVTHRKLILPQLGAPGVSAQNVKRASGFEVIWGPVRSHDLKAFLEAGCTADDGMRSVTFSMKERMVLVPVEIYLLRKPFLWLLLAIFALSGIGRQIYSISAAIERGLIVTAASIVAILVGCALVPILLPWVPGRAFALKGALMGIIVSAGFVIALSPDAQLGIWAGLSLVLFASAISSYLAMNFTGTTPYTSPSGVEKEMRAAIPIQLAAIVVAAGLWVGNAF